MQLLVPMDLLSAAYSATSDDDADGTEATPAASCATMDFTSANPPPPKRPRWEPSTYLHPPDAIPQPAASHATPLLAAPTGGRYVSKRERALLAVLQAPVGSASPLPSPVASEFNSPGEESWPPCSRHGNIWISHFGFLILVRLEAGICIVTKCLTEFRRDSCVIRIEIKIEL